MKTIKKIPEITFRPAGRVSLLTGTKFAVRLIELPFTLQHDREFVMFRFYFPLFIKLFMVLLCVIFKREWYLRAARAHGILSTPACDVYVLLKTTGAAIKIARGATVLTIKKINIIRWNMYRDNNFHSRRKILRVKCLCSENHESGKHKLIYVLNGLPWVCYFSRWTRGKKIAKNFLLTAKIITIFFGTFSL